MARWQMLEAEDRFWAKVDKRGPDECWLWTGAIVNGYGMFWAFDRMIGAHRFAYEEIVGFIPEGLVLDHLCRVRACCNPAHLEAVTQRENALRGVGPTAANARKTHCKRGHEFTPENTYVIPTTGSRQCRSCANGLP